MKVVIAPDSFKGSMDSSAVANYIERGILRVFPDAVIEKFAISDGGEGLIDSLIEAVGGRIIKKEVKGPLGQPVDSFLAVLADEKTAVIEMAAASGLPLVPRGKANPLKTTTYGTGELIKAALDEGISKLIIGIGGSATNDAGVGMMQALGAQFLDNSRNEVSFGGGYLKDIKDIDLSKIDFRLKDIKIEVACDVDNPLYGENGAAYIYGPQKGATEEMVKILDRNLKHFSDIVKRELGVDLQHVPGTGAAGGMGASLFAFLNADLLPGSEIVLSLLHFEDFLHDASLVFTGEGKTDIQTINGKVPIGVATLAKKYNVPVISIAGEVEEKACSLLNDKIDALLSISQKPATLEEAFVMTPEWIELSVEQIMRVYKINN
ncbi:MAG: glycerate kinase [Halanaerobiaceae bacterium]